MIAKLERTLSYKTSGRHLKKSNQLSLPHQDDCKTRKDTKSQDIRKTIKVKQPTLSLPQQDDCKTRKDTKLQDIRKTIKVNQPTLLLSKMIAKLETTLTVARHEEDNKSKATNSLLARSLQN